MTRTLVPIILTLTAAHASPADLQRQNREQERQIRQLEIEVAQLRWELEREKARNSGEAMLLPELPDRGKTGAKQEPRPRKPPETHTVRKGENMYRIALKYGLTLKQLQAVNPGIDPLELRIGQKLRLKPARPDVATPMAKGS